MQQQVNFLLELLALAHTFFNILIFFFLIKFIFKKLKLIFFKYQLFCFFLILWTSLTCSLFTNKIFAGKIGVIMLMQ